MTTRYAVSFQELAKLLDKGAHWTFDRRKYGTLATVRLSPGCKSIVLLDDAQALLDPEHDVDPLKYVFADHLVLGVRTIANGLGVSQRLIIRLIQWGAFPAHQPSGNGAYIVMREDLIAYLRKCRTPATRKWQAA